MITGDFMLANGQTMILVSFLCFVTSIFCNTYLISKCWSLCLYFVWYQQHGLPRRLVLQRVLQLRKCDYNISPEVSLKSKVSAGKLCYLTASKPWNSLPNNTNYSYSPCLTPYLKVSYFILVLAQTLTLNLTLRVEGSQQNVTTTIVPSISCKLSKMK